MLYSPVDSQQTPAQKQLSSTKHFMEENQTVKRLFSRRWHKRESWDLLFGKQLPRWTFFPPPHGNSVEILRGVWMRVTLPEARRSTRRIFPWDVTNQSRYRRWGWKGQGGTVKLRQSVQQHLLCRTEMFPTWSLSTRTVSRSGNGKYAFVQSLAHLFEMDASWTSSFEVRVTSPGFAETQQVSLCLHTYTSFSSNRQHLPTSPTKQSSSGGGLSSKLVLDFSPTTDLGLIPKHCGHYVHASLQQPQKRQLI